MIELKTAIRAVNQLTSVIVGAQSARETDSLKEKPVERVRKCMELALLEAGQSNRELLHLDDASTREKKMAQSARKLDSLNSLSVFAELVEDLIRETEGFEILKAALEP